MSEQILSPNAGWSLLPLCPNWVRLSQTAWLSLKPIATSVSVKFLSLAESKLEEKSKEKENETNLWREYWIGFNQLQIWSQGMGRKDEGWKRSALYFPLPSSPKERLFRVGTIPAYHCHPWWWIHDAIAIPLPPVTVGTQHCDRLCFTSPQRFSMAPASSSV